MATSTTHWTPVRMNYEQPHLFLVAMASLKLQFHVEAVSYRLWRTNGRSVWTSFSPLVVHELDIFILYLSRFSSPFSYSQNGNDSTCSWAMTMRWVVCVELFCAVCSSSSWYFHHPEQRRRKKRNLIRLILGWIDLILFERYFNDFIIYVQLGDFIYFTPSLSAFSSAAPYS